MSLPTDVITLPADITGPGGRAWRFDLSNHLRFRPEMVETATVAIWMVEAAWAHPVWHSYVLFLVHLRPIAGQPNAEILLEGATHQFWLYALDPGWSRQDMLASGRFRWLTPPNFCAQLAERDDATAIARVEAAVASIAAGTLNPDTDALRQWLGLFGDAMVRPEFRS